MSENETINPANIPKAVYPPTAGLGKIEGKPVTITGFTHVRIKPKKDTDPKKIGVDGLVDLFTVETKESFQIDHKDEGVLPINHFYSTSFVNNRIKMWVGESMNGKSLGPVKFKKLKKTDNPKETFWGIYAENEEQY